jgi:altronate hydrolase
VSGRALLRLAPADNVATALEPLQAGATVALDDLALTIREAVPLCHKVALADLEPGAAVVKYGQPIGRTTTAIRAGCHVHVHNMRSDRGQGESGGAPAAGGSGQAGGG